MRRGRLLLLAPAGQVEDLSRWRSGLVALVLAGVLGCTADKPLASLSWLRRPQSFRPVDSDAVQMEAALIDAPAGDRFINTGLWTFVDEQIIAPEKKDVLESSGFRVGQAGSLPDELRELIQSERSCPSARRIAMHSGGPGNLLELGPSLARCRFELPQGEKAITVEVEKAQCCLLVTPTLTEAGRTRLTFTPQVKHAARGLMPWRPKADLSGWMRQGQEAVESYPALAWEVTLAPGQYAFVGARWDRPGSLGHASLIRTGEATPVQRLLVIRTARPAIADFGPAGSSTSRPPPLALHVNWNSARGVAP